MSTPARESRLPTPPPSNISKTLPVPMAKSKSKLPTTPSLTSRQKSNKKPLASASSISLSSPPSSSSSISLAAKPLRSVATSSSLSPPSLKTARSKSTTPGASPSMPLTPAAAKRKAVTDAANALLEKDALILALTEQVVALEAKLRGEEAEDTSVAKETSPSVQIAQLNAKVNAKDLAIEKLEQRLGAFATKDSGIALLMAEKEDLELRFDQVVKDKDMIIETMRKQIEMQVMGLFAEVSKSRDLLVSQSATHSEDVSRMNAIIASQAAELSQLREELKQAQLQKQA
ncbi:hypothetical protein HDU78_008657 [Chytriomyces hyalinus]|nr:hypothetical protein HDU78_008657 [Chytriomyces hyalinus]KAJ3262155.1 hypothetical protein HDU77_000441 [Chytriomyces hyalinus]